MVKMYIAKNEDGHILIAKPEDTMTNFVNLKDVVKIVMIQTQNGMAPVPCYYPNLIMKDIVKKDILNKMDVMVDSKDYVVIDEENIIPDMLELYNREIAKREGVPPIQIVGSVPPNLKLVR
jgi:predicted transcriptional regulator